MRLHAIEYDCTSSIKSDGYGYNQRASYSRSKNVKKGIYVALASVAGGFAIKTLYDSVHWVDKDYDAIVLDSFTGKRKYVREEEGLFFTNPFFEKVIPVHERYGNTTLEGMLDELEIYKMGKEATALYHIKLKDDADLEEVIKSISPYIGKHFSVVVIPRAKFAEIEGSGGGLCYGKDYIEVNQEFAKGGVWENNPIVYHVIIHENVHPQGAENLPWGVIGNETTVEIISSEIGAEISADGIKKFEAGLYEWLEERILQASYLRAKEENRIPFWTRKVEDIYGRVPVASQMKQMPEKELEDYGLFPYVKIKLAMAEGNVVYDLKEYDTSQNPDGGDFKIDDLAKFLDSAEKTYGSENSLKMNLDDLFIIQSVEYGTSKK